MEIIFHSHANKTHFHKKGCAPSLILKVRVFGTRKWPIPMINSIAGVSFRALFCLFILITKKSIRLSVAIENRKFISGPFVLIILSLPFSIVTSVNGILSRLLSMNLALIRSKSPFQVICSQSCINSHTLYELYFY